MSTLEATKDPASLPSLDLLLDVELEATIRFGGRHLALRDILAMKVGSVVELDERINEPAELFVAGRLIARGDVVVVDDCFGLRVTEVVSAPDGTSLLPT